MEMNRWTPEEVYIILILGSPPSYLCSLSGKQSKETKHIKYMISHAILIQRLSKYFGIPNTNFRILVKGTKEPEAHARAGEKLYLQLSSSDIYEVEVAADELNSFIYFFDEENGKLPTIDKGVPKKSKILCFIEDHGITPAFPILQIYLSIMHSEPSSLRLFNDSCYSGSIINIIVKYYEFSEAWEKVGGIDRIDFKELKSLSKLANRIGSFKFHITPESERKPIEEYCQLDSLICVVDGLKQMIELGADKNAEGSNVTRFRIILRYISNMKNSAQFKKFRYSSSPITEIANIDQESYDDTSIIIQSFTDLGFRTFGDIFIFHELIDIYSEFCSILRSVKNLFQLYNEENVRIAIEVSKGLKVSSSKELYEILELFERQNFSKFDDYMYSFPQDQSFITSVYPNGKSITFGTRIIKDTNTKVILGSPAFSAFINEVFLNITDMPFNVKNILKEVSGFAEETPEEPSKCGVIEYAAVCSNKEGEWIRNEWIRLNIEEKTFGELSNERFFNQEMIEEKTNIDKNCILNEIGFKLVQRFKEDGEKPIDELNDFIEPMKNETRRIRIRRSYKQGEIEDDEYYSEDEIYVEDKNILKSSTPSASPSATALESEADSKYVILKESEAKKIIEKLNLPAVSWGVDVYRFIIMALTKKSKHMELDFAFNPKKESGFDKGFYSWAWASMKNYIDVCQIHDAHKLVLRISDWANDNFFDLGYDFRVLEQLIASVCRLANQHITELYKPYSIPEVAKQMRAAIN